jgi:hypothetical protein
MKNIYILFLFFTLLPLYTLADSSDIDNNSSSGSKAVIRSIWKYEQDLSAYSYDNGIAKKIYYLSLNSDGTYHQYVQVIPSSPQNYYKVRNFEISGKWFEKNGKLILEEYGKENAIDYNFMYSNFENIDNQFISKK